MPFVQRGADGRIHALFNTEQTSGQEYLGAEHPEVRAFLSGATDSEHVHQALQQTDAELARVTEDLINLLVEKNLICFTDLPEAVQGKLLSREQLRARLSDSASPISDDDTL
ncbi:MAG: hypothetical protein R3183_09695 [Oleiphilaceae bacterium]|nr:hypothetical protein [Oleiphilaceae bacterium]